jgi:mersacidin/lichenicidin family type 2 lantibiotic
MAKVDIVRAWKNQMYRDTLGPEELSGLPANPAGLVELADSELKRASGVGAIANTTAPKCTEYTLYFHRCCPK